MSKALVFLLLVLAPLFAAAQNCYGPVYCEGKIHGDLQIQRGDKGWHAWVFWTPNGMTDVKVAYLTCPHDAGGCTGAAAKVANEVWDCKSATDFKTCLSDAKKRTVSWSCEAVSTAQQTALCQEAIDFMKNDAKLRGVAWPPVTQSYVVSRSGMSATATTRPVYPYTGGVRGTSAVSGVRATIGAACDCSVKSIEGASLYCAHDAAKQTVTLCRAQ